MTVKTILPLGLPLLAVIIILIVVQPPGLSSEKISGAVISAGLWIIGYGLLRWGEGQNQRILLGMLIGGILFRIAFVLLSIYFVQKFTNLEIMTFVISLLIFYLACEFGLVVDYALRR